MASFSIEFWWVPEHIGGHGGPPYDGMRTAVRWQRHLGESLKMSVDVQWKSLDFDADSQQGTARCELSGRVSIPEDWIKEGELVEFVNGFRVLAIGKISSVT